MSYAPVLTAPQIDRIRPFAKPRQVAEGEVLYRPDDETPPVFVVLSGAIRILAVMARSGPSQHTVPDNSPGNC
jgi:thioredoxin reductase (NADPH)